LVSNLLLLVFFLEYTAGEIVYSAFEYSWIYFIPISLIDALTILFLTSNECDERDRKYSYLCMLSIINHFYGGLIFLAEFNMILYFYFLMVILCLKISLLGDIIIKVLDHAGRCTFSISSGAVYRMVCGSYRLAYT